jgi:hypothetical protein
MKKKQWKLSSTHWKYWMTLHATWIEFNIHWFELKFQRNRMQIDVENIIKLFIVSIIHNYGVESKQKRHRLFLNVFSIPIAYSKPKSILLKTK